MTTTYDKDGAYIEVTTDGVVHRRSIKWADCVVSVPSGANLKIDSAYVNASNQLMLVMEDDSEITMTALEDLDTHDTDIKALLAIITAYLDTAVSTDWKGNFNWDTSAYTTVEQDISALFSTNLAIATRRKYSVKLDLTAVEADASFVSLYLTVKEKIDGTNYRAIDRKTVLKAHIAASAEPGIIIDIPATSENIQITMQMSTALAGDATIYYAVVKEHLE